jgi:hypothetical protein
MEFYETVPTSRMFLTLHEAMAAAREVSAGCKAEAEAAAAEAAGEGKGEGEGEVKAAALEGELDSIA